MSLFLVLLPAGTISARYGNPPTTGAISRGTVPPSSYRNALVNTPNPIDNTSSLAVTGNADGGKSFRGNIPYGSTTSFAAPLGSTSLDPFLRYSALPEASSRGSFAAGSFYSPTGTMPKLEPASTWSFAPGSPRIAAGVLQSAADQPVTTMLAPEMSPSQALAARSFAGGESTAGTWISPWARTPEEMRRLVVGEPDAAPANQGPAGQTRQLMTAQEYQRQVEQLQRELDGVRTRASAFERDLGAGRQPSVGEALTQRPGEMPLPSISAETLRRIIQPESQMPFLSSTTNPAAGQDLSFSPTLAAPGQPGASGLGELTLLSPGQSLAGSQPEALRRIIQPGPQTPPLSSTGNPSAGQDLSSVPAVSAPGRPAASGLGDSTLLSPGISPAGPQPEALRRIIQPGSRTSPLSAPTVSAPGRSAASELSLLSPGQSLAGSRPEALSPSRPELSGPSSTVMPSSAERAEQMRRIDAIFAPRTDTTAAPKSNESGNPLPAMQRAEGIARAFDAPRKIIEHPLQDSTSSVSSSVPGNEPMAPPQADVQAAVRNAIRPSQAPPKAPDPVPPPPADRPAAVPAPPDPVAQGKVEAYMKLAQSQVQQGQYAQAAESFALACVYNPRDARPQLGRSHALLAAGEYLGSAVCLAKAIELDPRFTLADSDLVETLGGPDRFLQRINDLQERAKASTAPGLQLLLAYVYHQTKAPEQARAAIQAAKKALPSSPSVALLEHVIAGGSLN